MFCMLLKGFVSECALLDINTVENWHFESLHEENRPFVIEGDSDR